MLVKVYEKYGLSSSRVYCVFAKSTNSNSWITNSSSHGWLTSLKRCYLLVWQEYNNRVRAGAWNPWKVLKLKNQFQGHLKSPWEIRNPSKCLRHTSKPGPDSDSDLDSDPKKTRTREKPGLVLGLALEKPGLDNRKSGLQIENTGFDETGFW